MPANTWSYTDKTPIQVIKTIVEGVGGYVNSHPSTKVLKVRSSYPVGSWDWPTTSADISLPNEVILSRKLKWTQKPEYTGIYVSGEQTGVTSLVRLTSSDGAFQPPMYVNPMISHDYAAREYGKNFLSSVGKQAEVAIDLPLGGTVPLFTPGNLVEFVSESSWKGFTRGVTVFATVDEAKGVNVLQRSLLERHYWG
jgi:hypothetical protein